MRKEVVEIVMVWRMFAEFEMEDVEKEDGFEKA